ncbi:MAG: aspartyl protease family protein [Chthoniobacter sp.]
MISVVAGAILSCLALPVWPAGTDVVLFRQKLPVSPGVVLVEGRIGGRECRILVDTGAEFSVVDRALSNLAKAPVAGAEVTDSAGQKLATRVFGFPDFQIQSLRVKEPRGVLIDLDPFSQRFGGKWDAVLGVKGLQAGKLLVDWDAGVMELHSGPWKMKESESTEDELNMDGGLPAFAATIAGHRGEFVIDTGSDGEIDLESSFFAALVRDDCIEVSSKKGTSLAAAGSTEVMQGWFLHGELMGKDLQGISVRSVANVKGTGRVGMRWLSGFNSEMDWQTRRWRFQKRPMAMPPLDIDLMIGGEFAFLDGGARVEELRSVSGGPMEEAGLRKGDIVREFGTLHRGQLSLAAIGEVVTAMAGQPVNMQYTRAIDGQNVRTALKLPPPIREGDFPGRDIYDKREGPGSSKVQMILQLRNALLELDRQSRASVVLFAGYGGIPAARLRLTIQLGAGDILLQQKLPEEPGMIFIDAEIGGKKGTLLLNTAGEYTMIDPSLRGALQGPGIVHTRDERRWTGHGE